MKKLVLFDLDGTLINAGGAGKAALTQAVKELYGKEPKFEASYIAGRTDTDNFAIVYELVKGSVCVTGVQEQNCLEVAKVGNAEIVGNKLL